MTSTEKRIVRECEKLQNRIAELEYATIPVQVWRVRCCYPSTSVVVLVKGKTTDDAVEAARKQRIGKGADSYVVLGVVD